MGGATQVLVEVVELTGMPFEDIARPLDLVQESLDLVEQVAGDVLRGGSATWQDCGGFGSAVPVALPPDERMFLLRASAR